MALIGIIPTGTAAQALPATHALAALTAPDAVSLEEDIASLSDGEGNFEDGNLADDSDLDPDSIDDIKSPTGECFSLAPARLEWPYPDNDPKWLRVQTHRFDSLPKDGGKMSVKRFQMAAWVSEMAIAATDGSANPNPGPGGLGGILVGNGKCTELAGRTSKTSNNQMELTAAIQAFRAAPLGVTLWLMTDFEYVLKGVTIWSTKWNLKTGGSTSDSIANVVE
jgi:hypothetical protein